MESAHLGSNIETRSKPSSRRLCGFAIRGNQHNRANPHVEWDFNIDEIVTPDRTVAGVSAGTFDVTDHRRKPRPAITGFRDRRKFGGGKNSYFNECMRGFKTLVPGQAITVEHH